MALIRYYFGTVPENSDEFAEQWQQLCFGLKFDGKLNEKEIQKG